MKNVLEANRRDFIRFVIYLTGAGVGVGCGADRIIAPGEKTWATDRFFENPSSFDSVKALEIRGGLLDFGGTHGDLFKSEHETNRFDEKKWSENVDRSLAQLKRIAQVYTTLQTQNKLEDKAKVLLERDFYDSGSVLWAMLRVGERFANDAEGLKQALNDAQIRRENGFEDPLLGDDVFTIHSPWADTFTDWANSGWSRITRFISASDVQYGAAPLWWREKRGPEALTVYKADSKLPRRPAKISVGVQGKPELETKVLEILEQNRFDRVSIDLEIIDNSELQDEPWSGVYFDFTGSVYRSDERNQARNISISAAGDTIEEVFERYPYLVEGMITHEAGHALWELLPFIEDDIKLFEHRVRIEQMLDTFRPVLSMKSFFQPEGKFFSQLPPHEDEDDDWWTNETWNKLFGQVNMTTVTQYASWLYAEYDFSRVSELMQHRALLHLPIADDQMRDLNTPIFGHFEMLPDEFQGRDGFQTFRDFWTAATTNIGADFTSDFEKMVFDEISNNLDVFEATERYNYLYENWLYYLKNDVIPVVCLHLYVKDPNTFIETFLGSYAGTEAHSALKHAVENTFLPLVNKRALEGHPYVRGDLWTDCELFADIVSYNCLRKRPGVTNEIDEALWNEVDSTLYGLVDTLVENGLAQAPTAAKKA